MNCSECGQPINSTDEFCTKCGKKNMAQENIALNKKNMHSRNPFVFGLFGIIIGVIGLAIVLFALNALPNGQGSIEGRGYRNPTDAGEAYLLGLKNQDFDAMISTFAVESYHKNCNFQAQLERYSAYRPNFPILLPNDNDFAYHLNLENRKKQIVQNIINQYMVYNVPSGFNDGQMVALTNTDDLEDFIDTLEDETEDYIFDDIKIIASTSYADQEGTPSARQMTENILDLLPNNVLQKLPSDAEEEIEDILKIYIESYDLGITAKNAEIYGVKEDDLTDIAVLFEANGQLWIACFETVKYNGKWYIGNLNSTIGALSGWIISTGGIQPIND
ncbi:MAG: zinc ribbon domain-containing protein [Eubacteriales bacterium]